MEYVARRLLRELIMGASFGRASADPSVLTLVGERGAVLKLKLERDQVSSAADLLFQLFSSMMIRIFLPRKIKKT